MRSRYHLAINARGFMLRGAPQAPAYRKTLAPNLLTRIYFNRLGVEDLGSDPLNGARWDYWHQTDWTGGHQVLKFQDDGSFKDGQGVDTLTEFGSIKLQNGFTSAISISGSHAYGSHHVNSNELILGSIKAGTAKVFKITSANVLSTLSAYAGISAVNSMSRFGDNILIGLTRTSGTLKTLSVYTGSTISGFRSTNPIVRAVKGIGIRAYIAEYITAISGDRLSYATTLSAFTSAYNAGKNRKIKKIVDLGGAPYFFVEEGQTVEMYRWDELTNRPFPIYKFDNFTAWGVTKYLSLLIIGGLSNGKHVAYSFNGAKLQQIFDDQLVDQNYNFSMPFEYYSNLQFKGAFWDGQNWFPGLYGKYATVQYTPFVNFMSKPYAYAVTGSLMKVAYYNSAKFQISGNLTGSEFGFHLGGVDKLINSVTVTTNPLAANQLIEMQQSSDGGSNFVSIGKLSGVNKISAKMYISGLVKKSWLYKIVLVGPSTSSPIVQDVIFEYRPSPDIKRRWSLTLDAGDEIMLLNQQKEQRDGKAIVGELWAEKQAKRTVQYEDLDAFSAKFVSAMTSAATSARVKNTRLMPPRGRIRVFKNGISEEMVYTSADGGSIKGITRGLQSTRPRAYTSADTMDNYYTVIVDDVSETANDTDQLRTESIVQVQLLEI